MKLLIVDKIWNRITRLVNFQFLISNFYSISNVSMSKFVKRGVATFRNSNIKNSLEISNLKLEIRELLAAVFGLNANEYYKLSHNLKAS